MKTTRTYTAAIIYGLGEGPRIAKRLQRALTEADFTVIENAADADIILAHSGGCFVIPTPHRAQHIFMIGIPPTRPWSLLKLLARKVWGDFHAHRRAGDTIFWLRKTHHNGWYIYNLSYNLRMLRGMRTGGHWALGEKTTVIHYIHDIYHTAGMPFAHQPPVVTLPGHHDECWRDPAPLIKVVQSVIQSSYGS